MARLDDAVGETLCERLFKPERLAGMLREIEARGAVDGVDADAELIRLEADLVDAKDRLSRLYGAIERGVADLDDDGSPHASPALGRIVTSPPPGASASARGAAPSSTCRSTK